MQITFESASIAFLLALLAGASTSLGAIIAFFSHENNSKMLSTGLGFSAGAMIYISFAELLPEAIKDFSKHFEHGDMIALGVFFLSMFLCIFIDKIVPKDVNPHEFSSADSYEELKFCDLDDKEILQARTLEQSKNTKKHPLHHHKHTLKRTGIFTALAIALHNFPEGFATFASGLESLQLGLMIALAVAIHNIPEGIAVSLPIYHATGNKRKAFIYTTFSGLAEPIGALVGTLFLLPFFGTLGLGISFAFVAGVMIFISLDELFPIAKTYASGHECLYGLIGGMAVMAVSLKLFSVV